MNMEDKAQQSPKKPSEHRLDDRSEHKSSIGFIEKNDLHFLVTHWLANYNAHSGDLTSKDDPGGNRKEVVDRIHDLAIQLSDEFCKLGAYGNILRNPLNNKDGFTGGSTLRNATYTDIANKWTHLAPTQLESIAGSSLSASNAVLGAIRTQQNTPISILDAAYETHSDLPQRDAIDSLNNKNHISILQPATLLLSHSSQTQPSSERTVINNTINDIGHVEKQYQKMPAQPLHISLGSDRSKMALLAADASRHELSVRDKLDEKEHLLATVLRSLSIHKKNNNMLIEQMNNEHNSNMPESNSESYQSKKLECERVISQLSRSTIDIQEAITNLRVEYKSAVTRAADVRRQSAQISSLFYDPILTSARVSAISTLIPPYSSPHFIGKGNKKSQRLSITQSIISRQYTAGGQGLLKRKNNFLGNRPSLPLTMNSSYKSLLTQKLAHSVTINCHLVYPVYCLCFDQTGRYFVTGADDHLVKLFYLGGAVSTSSNLTSERNKYDLNPKGAVLVTSLRGHAGVVTDIDISADNTLLATASEDGSCRVWGLYDGCPVAVLRGHVGGANMVSWSKITPFRLVTSSMDGLARMWDVREAALKRYVSQIGKRSDYQLPIRNQKFRNELNRTSDEEEINEMHDEATSSILHSTLPPIPQRLSEGGNTSQSRATNEDSNDNDIPMPPILPGDVPPIQGNNELTSAQAVIEANNDERCDEGVRLLSKLQHGEVLSGNHEQQQGPDTRSRRKTVKVICLSRCPVGGHFATGSDDGIGRIWEDSEDDRLELVDQYSSYGNTQPSSTNFAKKDSSQIDVVPSTNTLLATLTGHLNAITDIAYSHGGDRILTASQKDGVLRIWAWGKESRLNFHKRRGQRTQTGKNAGFANLTQILIRLTGFSIIENRQKEFGKSRRRGSSRSTTNAINDITNAQCDVAVWSSDDEKVITSQTVLAKANTNEIIPGSHVIHVWDSNTGKCLLGITGAHNSPCPVLAVHPSDSSILASAGADGCLYVWDLNSAESFFEYKNILKHGPCEASSKGKSCGFLDGSFSPNGLTLVLTDDAGRITILDSYNEAKTVKKRSDHGPNSLLHLRDDGIQVNGEVAEREESSDSQCDTIGSLNEWMKEQYFANDYYDIDYDVYGYAVERGSRAPPHLAPRASRCNHTGTAVSDQINIRFGRIRGPLPLSEPECRWRRDFIRSKMEFLKSNNCEALDRNVAGKRAVLIAQSGGATKRVNVTNETKNDSPIETNSQSQSQGQRPSQRPSASSTSRNYRYLGDDDLPEVEEIDDDLDEDYVASSSRQPMHESSSDDEEDDYDAMDSESNNVMSSSRSRVASNQPRGNSRVASRSTINTDREGRSHRRRRRNRSQEEREEFEERIASQASRTSSRQMARQRTTYEESDDDSDLDAQFLCRNTSCSQSNRYYQDYTLLGHFWRLPRNAIVQRKWLSREESRSGFLGLKPYSPQVGDKVVYIPRAHYDTLQKFAGTSESTPWKNFPRSRSWPIVQCVIKGIRYRFPYENYFRKSRDRPLCSSVVAIVKLEVTGIPRSNQREFPWVDPDLVSIQQPNTRSSSSFSEFEVSIFQNDELEFLIPEFLFRFRLSNLENAIRQNNNDPIGVELSSYYTEEKDDEDNEMMIGHCKVLEVVGTNDLGETHFQSSGYKSIKVLWENSDEDWLSSWEVSVPNDLDIHEPLPSLSEKEKEHYKRVLDELDGDDSICEYFRDMVDCSLYIDYLECVEVPMYLSLIRKRLDGYYTNRLSLFEDMNLIVENCRKYNEEDADIVQTAELLKKTFFELSESIDYGYVEEDNSEPGTPAAVSVGAQRTSAARPNNVTVTSSLENLPEPLTTTRDYSSEDCSHDNDESLPYSQRKRRLSARASVSSTANPYRTRSKHSPSQDLDSAVCILQQSLSDSSNESSPRIHDRTQFEDGGDKDTENLEASASIVSRLRSKTKSIETSHPESDTSENNGVGYYQEEPQSATNRLNEKSIFSEDSSSENDSNPPSPPAPPSPPSPPSPPTPPNRTAPLRRSRRRRSSSTHYSENSSDAESQESFNSNDASEDNSEDDYEVPKPKQNTRKTRAVTNKRLADDNAFSSNHESSSEDDIMDTPPKTRKSTRTRRRRATSNDSTGYSSDDHEQTKTPKRNARTQKRRKTATPAHSEDTRFFPTLQTWPSIDNSRLEEVANSIMEKMALLDSDNVFTYPVPEAFPALASRYLNIIHHPMDFRTINEERIQCYSEISELQDDLILVFKNCCRFNGEKADLWPYSISLWNGLKEVFKETCKEKNILLPRRF